MITGLGRGRSSLSWFVRQCAFFALLATVSAASQQGSPKRVLLLFDEDRTLPGLAMIDRSLRSGLSAGSSNNAEFFTESMNLSQFNDEHYEHVLRQYYFEKYSSKKLDLIVAVLGPALTFLLRNADIFPGVPIVFCGADAADIQAVSVLLTPLPTPFRRKSTFFGTSCAWQWSGRSFPSMQLTA